MKRHSIKARIAISSVALVGAAFSGVALSSGSDGGEQKAAPASPVYAPAEQAPAELRERFALLRTNQERGPEDEVPGLGNDGSLAKETGVALDKSQRVQGDSRRAVWVAPSPNGFCFFHQPDSPEVRGPGVGCWDEPQVVLDGRAWLTAGTVSDGGADLIALLPDGVQAATVTFSDGSKNRIPVRSNVLFVHTNQHTESYAYELDGEIHAVQARTFRG